MLISYNWIQKYFKDKLPSPEDLAEKIEMHAFEVERIEEKNNDFILDIVTTTDRNCYGLSHQGIVYEISAILDLEKQNPNSFAFKEMGLKPISIMIEDPKACPRYAARRIENVKVEESPTWLKEKLQSLNQNSINNIVDSANYVMLDVGQPLHIFDADKVQGEIMIRQAKEGESFTTLDNREIKLDSEMLVIADKEGALGLAGIKGGKRAEVSFSTKNIIIEAANFSKISIRKTDQKIGFQTDASRRFEAGLTPELVLKGMNEVTQGIFELNQGTQVGKILDVYPSPQSQTNIIVSPEKINQILGTDLSPEEIKNILGRLEIEVEAKGEKLSLKIPFIRLDLQNEEDIAEEVGRLYGYEKIKDRKLNKIAPASTNKNFYWQEKIKDILSTFGFSEIMTRTLASHGDFEVEKSLASDKKFLRTNLSDSMSEALKLNLYNAPFLGLDQIKIFEISKVFPKTGEYLSLCAGIANTKGFKGESVNEQIRQTREKLIESLNAKITTVCTIDDNGGILIIKGKPVGKINEIDGIMELNLDALIATLPDLSKVETNLGVRLPSFGSPTPKFKPFSSYPFILRDIAVFVRGDEGKDQEVLDLIKEEGTDLLVRADLFDVFTKTIKETNEKKTSYAFSLVFQSQDRTLTDEEINKIMNSISTAMTQNKWEVR